MKMIKLFAAGILLIGMNLFVRENKKNDAKYSPSIAHPTQPTSHNTIAVQIASSLPAMTKPAESFSSLIPVTDKTQEDHPQLLESKPQQADSTCFVFDVSSEPQTIETASITMDEKSSDILEPIEPSENISPSQPIEPHKENPSSSIASETAILNPATQSSEIYSSSDTYNSQTCPTSCNPCPVDPCAKCAQLWPSCGPEGVITPNAGPCVINGADLFITAEFLYWTIRQDHLAFAFSTPEIIDPLVIPEGKGSVFHPDWEFNPGFKVGLGILFDHDGWDLYANYTWIRSKNIRKNTSIKSGFVLRDFTWERTTQTENDNDRIQTIQGEWDLNFFNVIDLELGRNFFLSRCLQMRPHFGLKGTWQEQKFFVTAHSLNFLNAEESTNVSENIMYYWGIGIRSGLDTSWHFTNCFSLFGEFALTALWESFDVDVKIYENNLSLGIFSGFLNTKNTFHTIKPALELYIGLRFETWFCCDEFHLSLEAGWEEQWWANQNQFFAFSSESRLGDLILQGLTIKIRFDF